MPPQAKKKPSKKIDPDFVLNLMKQNKDLLFENEKLKEETLKIRIPEEMTPGAFNWCVAQLGRAKIKFEQVDRIPEPVDEDKA